MKSELLATVFVILHRSRTMYARGFVTVLVILYVNAVTAAVRSDGHLRGLLYPRQSETREVLSLDGLWNFAYARDSKVGYNRTWYKNDLTKVEDYKTILMPVPSSYNDVTQDMNLRDHVGVVWYDRTFFVPESWGDRLVWIRFGSIHYLSQVWINSELATQHEFGHLPFAAEISGLLRFGEKNRVTVACDNMLGRYSIPQGSVQTVQSDNGPKLYQSYSFDFFNYAGIHRSVYLYTTPKSYIDDVAVTTEVETDKAIINYNVTYISNETLRVNVTLYDKNENLVAEDSGLGQNEGSLFLSNYTLWWPHLMNDVVGYLYTLKIELLDADDRLLDIYRLNIGIRSVSWNNTSITINGKPIYFTGFGRHEDSDIRGKGLDLPLLIRDHSLLKWVGANAYRTSHYPYAEEIMEMADRDGFMIIDECPSVNTEEFSDTLLNNHKRSLTELIHRDKNHPSVIAWSIANEPRTQNQPAEAYFKSVAEHVRSLDSTRPITLAVAQGVQSDYSGKFLDFISFNRYNAWYSNGGQLDTIVNNVVAEAVAWNARFNKPVLMCEYGADTMIGLHLSPSYIWSEEYQSNLLSNHFKAFDILRGNHSWWIGEFVWNFADFATAQTYTRVGGNRKGVFTRNRQPKASAHLLRKRYYGLAKELYGASVPGDLYEYVSTNSKVEL